MTIEEIKKEIESLSGNNAKFYDSLNPTAKPSMGVRMPDLRKIAKRIAKEKEEARIEAKRKERRAKNRIRRAAIRRAEEYQAKKIANEKYGVPMDFKE